MLNWWRKKTPIDTGTPVLIDMHSHLLPGLDDGVQSFEDAAAIIRIFQELGYTKLITTPHVMSDIYRNNTKGILERLHELKLFLKEQQIDMTVEAAAEYYLDEQLIRLLEKDEQLLTFGDRYLLFETNFLTEPYQLKEFIFLLGVKGYRPVFAHPERYLYLQRDLTKAEDLIHRDVLFQLNASSFTGYYSKAAQVTAQQLVSKGWVHFIGSDCHAINHLDLLKQARKNRYFQKALTLPLLNNTL
ncbi:MAG: capsular biosynthesis protein [Cyclobacteriaceae bacterium]|jgi:tyrosine-protein phosphatase YwqE|nr:capsular biosynthesis protein [Cyclobacteriaceae bacterium]